MKSILILISLVTTSAFAAQDFDAVTEVSVTVAQVSSVDENIASVTLNNSGVLVVRKHDKSIKTLKLAPANKQVMLYTASLLSEAELTGESSDVVCAMIIDPRSIQNLLVMNTDAGDLQMVLSHRSCAIADSIFPKQQYAMEAAIALKAQMITLAQQLVAQSK